MTLKEFKKLSGLETNQQVAIALSRQQITVGSKKISSKTSLDTVKSWGCERRNPDRLNQLKMDTYLEELNATTARHDRIKGRVLSNSSLDRIIETSSY
jgi:hypothetical protein